MVKKHVIVFLENGLITKTGVNKVGQYYDDIKIDKHALDDEWLDNGRRLIDWTTEKAESDYQKDKAKEQLDLTKAEIEADIRKNPKDFGLTDKATLPAIASAVIADERYKDQYEVYLQCVKNSATLTGVVSAFTQRKTSLENLTKIWLAGMYADPVVSKEAREKATEITTKKTAEKIRKKLAK